MINAGLDIGNGYVKALIRNTDTDVKSKVVDMPSAAAVITNSADVRISDPAGIAKEIDDIYNSLEVSIDSPLIADNDVRMYIGKRAVKSGKSLQEFNLKETRRSKSETELSAILVLSILAGKGLQDYYAQYHKLPGEEETIRIDVNFAMSLPITEYKYNKDTVARNYKAQSHLVRIHNFEHVVRVDVHINDAITTAEGASAQFTIAYKMKCEGDKFTVGLMKDMIKNGISVPEDIAPADIAAATGIIGIDIGEGTVNFPIYQDLQLNTDVSTTFNKGYGTVLDEAVIRLAQLGRPFDSRKKLMEWLRETENKPLMRSKRTEALKIIEAEASIFVDELVKQFSAVLERNGAFAEIIYVYGGGAEPIRELLYPKLKKAISRVYGEDTFMPIFYLNKSYSRVLNRDGLYIYIATKNGYDIEDLNTLNV